MTDRPASAGTSRRAAGADNRRGDGRPLLFGDLYDRTPAWTAFGLIELGTTALGVGPPADAPAAVAIGGGAFVAAGIVATANLSSRPVRLRTAARLSQPDAERVAGVGTDIQEGRWRTIEP